MYIYKYFCEINFIPKFLVTKLVAPLFFCQFIVCACIFGIMKGYDQNILRYLRTFMLFTKKKVVINHQTMKKK